MYLDFLGANQGRGGAMTQPDDDLTRDYNADIAQITAQGLPFARQSAAINQRAARYAADRSAYADADRKRVAKMSDYLGATYPSESPDGLYGRDPVSGRLFTLEDAYNKRVADNREARASLAEQRANESLPGKSWEQLQQERDAPVLRQRQEEAEATRKMYMDQSAAAERAMAQQAKYAEQQRQSGIVDFMGSRQRLLRDAEEQYRLGAESEASRSPQGWTPAGWTQTRRAPQQTQYPQMRVPSEALPETYRSSATYSYRGQGMGLPDYTPTRRSAYYA